MRSLAQVSTGQHLQLQWADGLAGVQVTYTNPTSEVVVDPFAVLSSP